MESWPTKKWGIGEKRLRTPTLEPRSLNWRREMLAIGMQAGSDMLKSIETIVFVICKFIVISQDAIIKTKRKVE